MLLMRLSRKSILSRKATTVLTVISVALSVMLLLGIERIKSGAIKGFESTVSGTDLIVGARGGGMQLLLYSVFRIGNPSNNLSWESYTKFATHPEVADSVPISLGDSHKGFRVVATEKKYFDFFKQVGGVQLEFGQGRAFEDTFEAVIGSDVAQTLGYTLHQQIILSHGIEDISFVQHSNHPFTIVGILARTGTPIDRSVYVPLKAMDVIHQGLNDAPSDARKGEAFEISAFFIRTKSRVGVLQLQREINEYKGEPLTAILPGISLRELWTIMSTAEKSLTAISLVTFVISLIGMLLTFLSTLNERRREMAILRSLGASPGFIFGLLIFEAGLLATLGSIAGFLGVNGVLYALRPLLETRVGLDLTLFQPTSYDLFFLVMVILCAMLISSFPAWRAYRNSLVDGLTVRT